MNKLENNFLGISMKNPLIAASGTFGFGSEYNQFYDVSKLGGICSKGLTLDPKQGNSGTRIWETASGMINSIGLQNPGVQHFIENEFEQMKSYGSAVIVNLGGGCEDEYILAAEMLNQLEIDILELNISCPNVKKGGMAFGIKANDVAYITKIMKQTTIHPLMVKLSPNAENIVESALAAESAGADAVSLVNTFQAMAIDIDKRKAVFENVYAGLSGCAIKPIALRMVHQVSHAVNIPVCGIGGILTWQDALEFIMAGASTVQIGSGMFHDMYAPIKIIEGLEHYCEREGIENLSQIRKII